MNAGGTERVLSTLARAWANQGFDVILATMFSMDGGVDFYPLPPAIRRVRIADLLGIKSRSFISQVGRFVLLRRVIQTERPDCVIAFLDQIAVISLLATLGFSIPIIGSERANPLLQPLPQPWWFLRKLAYPRAKGIVIQTPQVKSVLQRIVSKARLTVIPNPIPPEIEYFHSNARQSGLRLRILSMGRFGAEKNFGLLIDAFSHLATSFTKWDLWIWGEGELRPQLEKQVATLGLSDRVFLPGKTSEPWLEMEKADIVALTSEFEGFPNVLLEAMALGKPCVASDCAFGPREITGNGEDAVLFPPGDLQKLVAGLGKLMGDRVERERLGKKALNVWKKYSLEAVLNQWDRLFQKVIPGWSLS